MAKERIDYQIKKRSIYSERFGLTRIEDENGFLVLIVEPEKAILDLIYLNLHDFKKKEEDIFGLSYRFQNLDILNKKSLWILPKDLKTQI